MTYLSYASPERPPLDFPDQRTGLTAAGVLLILVGLCSGCFGLLTPLTAQFVDDPTPRVGDTVGATVTLLGAAAAFVWIGVGSIRRRRWVRPVVLAVTGVWAAVGLLEFVFFLISLPQMSAEMRAEAAKTPGLPVMPFMVGMLLLALFGLVVLPALAFWYYRRPDVLATLSYYDPRPRWTDGRPVPVLAVSLWLVVAAVECALTTGMRPVLPAFGRALVGWPAVIGYAALAGVLGWLASATFRRSRLAWRVLVALVALWLASSVVTQMWGDLPGAYRRAGYTDAEINALGGFAAPGQLGGPIKTASTVAFWLAVLVYLLYVRRYFADWPSFRPASTGPASTSSTAGN